MSCCEMETCACNPLTDSERLAELEAEVERLGTQVAHVLHEIMNLRGGKEYGARE
jgi:hypothetical protein